MDTPMVFEKHMSPKQASGLTGYSTQYLAKLAKKGRLNPLKSESGYRRYWESEIRQLMREKEMKKKSNVLYLRACNENEIERQKKQIAHTELECCFDTGPGLELGPVFLSLLRKIVKGEVLRIFIPHEKTIIVTNYHVIHTMLNSMGVDLVIWNVDIGKIEKEIIGTDVLAAYMFPDLEKYYTLKPQEKKSNFILGFDSSDSDESE